MPLRLAVFDFDQTLSVFHVYRALAGESSGTPPPYARTEKGQLARVGELDHGGAFTMQVMGGPQRVQLMAQFLQELKAHGVDCVICTKGLVGPVRKLLDNAGLLGYFSEVYGNTGDTYGSTDYDSSIPWMWGIAERRYMGSSSASGWGTKSNLIQQLLAERGLSPGDAVFIDDDSSEIQGCAGTCRTVHVAGRQGMGNSEMSQVRGLVGAGGSGVAPVPGNMGYGPPNNYVPGVAPYGFNFGRPPLHAAQGIKVEDNEDNESCLRDCSHGLDICVVM